MIPNSPLGFLSKTAERIKSDDDKELFKQAVHKIVKVKPKKR